MSELERRIEELERGSLMHLRLGPSPWYPYGSQAEADSAREEFVNSLVAEIQGRQQMEEMRPAVLRLKCVVNSVKSVADSNGDKSQEELALSAVYSGSDGAACGRMALRAGQKHAIQQRFYAWASAEFGRSSSSREATGARGSGAFA